VLKLVRRVLGLGLGRCALPAAAVSRGATLRLRLLRLLRLRSCGRCGGCGNVVIVAVLL
jgi:hypothetical protein